MYLLVICSDKERDGETTSELERRKALKGIWITGRQGLSEREAAEFIIKEARSIIQVLIYFLSNLQFIKPYCMRLKFLISIKAELGLEDVNWDQRKQDNKGVKNEADSLLGKQPPTEESSSTFCEPNVTQCQTNVKAKVQKTEVHTENILMVGVEGNTSSRSAESFSTCVVQMKSEKDVTEAMNMNESNLKSTNQLETLEMGNNSKLEQVIKMNSADTINNSDLEKAVETVNIVTLNNSDIERVIELDNLETINNSHLEKIIDAENLIENNELIVPDREKSVEEKDETCHEADSLENISKNLSTDIFDNNICDFSNLSETLENCLPSTDKLATRDERVENFQANLDNFFETSFSNSALAKLAANITDVPFTNGKETSQSKNIEDNASIYQSGADSCLGSWSMNMSAIERLCAQEENVKILESQDKRKVDATDQTSISRRLSWDLFASPSENKNASIKESEDMFGSFITPVCDRVLRPRNRSGSNSNSKGKQSTASPQLFTDDSKSPSLFGDSFEINTGLMEALDGNANTTCSKLVPDGSPALELLKVPDTALKSALEEGDAKPLNCTKSGGKSNFPGQYPFKGKGCDSNGHKDPAVSRNGTNLRLGLSCRAVTKKSQGINRSVASSSKDCGNPDVLTDSFLEAAFQTAFYSESNMLDSSELLANNKEKNSSVFEDELVINKKRLKVSDLSDEEVLNTPPEKEKTLRYSTRRTSRKNKYAETLIKY